MEFKVFQPLNLPEVNSGPIYYNPSGNFGESDLKTLFIFVTAGRMIYNFSGIKPMIPLGIGALTAYLIQNNYFNIAVLDQPGWNLDEKELFKILKSNKFDIYGLSTNLFSLSTAVRISNYIKNNINKDSIIIIGGPSGVYAPQSILNECSAVDAVHVGEGENSMLSIINQCYKGEKPNNIPGLYWRNANKILYGGNVKYIDLTKSPITNRF